MLELRVYLYCVAYDMSIFVEYEITVVVYASRLEHFELSPFDVVKGAKNCNESTIVLCFVCCE